MPFDCEFRSTDVLINPRTNVLFFSKTNGRNICSRRHLGLYPNIWSSVNPSNTGKNQKSICRKNNCKTASISAETPTATEFHLDRVSATWYNDTVKVYFKQCQVCGGDLVESQDIYGIYIQCFQCSRFFEMQEVDRVTVPVKLQPPSRDRHIGVRNKIGKKPKRRAMGLGVLVG